VEESLVQGRAHTPGAGKGVEERGEPREERDRERQQE